MKKLIIAIAVLILLSACSKDDETIATDVKSMRAMIIGKWGNAELCHVFDRDGMYYTICLVCSTFPLPQPLSPYNITKEGDKFLLLLQAYGVTQSHEIVSLTNSRLTIRWNNTEESLPRLDN